jgi:hypothetical protein
MVRVYVDGRCLLYGRGVLDFELHDEGGVVVLDVLDPVDHWEVDLELGAELLLVGRGDCL